MRMPNPKAPRCDCNTLERAADEPLNPIFYDPQLNEYNIRCGENGLMRIYHCPFCGGSVPKSKRNRQFAMITHAESARLATLTGQFKTIREVLAAWGNPEEDHPTGEGIGHPEKGGDPETMSYIRVLTYKSLSETANIRVRVYPNENVDFTFMGKYIGDKSGGSA